MNAERKGAGDEKDVHVLPTWFCPKCGTPNNGEYCTNCMFDRPRSLPKAPLGDRGLVSWYALSPACGWLMILAFILFAVIAMTGR